MKQLGYTEVDCIRLDHLTDEERRAYTLAHNKLTMNTDFDLDILEDELKNIYDIDMGDFGFEAVDLTEDDIKEDDFEFEEEPEEEPEAKPGYVYQLGNHRLMCGDSTKAEDVQKLMNGKEMDLFLTDPPYNVDLGEVNKTKVRMAPERYKGANVSEIQNDRMEDHEFISFLTKAFQNADTYLKPGRSFYIWHSTTENYKFQTAMENTGWKLRQMVIWNKSSLCLRTKRLPMETRAMHIRMERRCGTLLHKRQNAKFGSGSGRTRLDKIQKRRPNRKNQRTRSSIPNNSNRRTQTTKMRRTPNHEANQIISKANQKQQQTRRASR